MIFEFEGRPVHWTVMGVGRPLVLLHGTPFSSAVWRRIAPLLALTRRVFQFDLLGYGQSDRGPGDVSLGIQNRLFAALLRMWQLDRPDVVAHDFGGATALRAHLLDGCEYRSLVLIDVVAVAPWGSPFVQHVRHHEAAFAGLPAYIHAAVLDAYLGNAAHRPLPADALAVYREPWEGPVGQAAFYRQIAQMDQRFSDEVEDRYQAVRCPVQILWGEEDRWIPIAQGQALAGRIAGSRFHAVPAAGHLVQDDAPEAIVAVAAEFHGTLAG